MNRFAENFDRQIKELEKKKNDIASIDLTEFEESLNKISEAPITFQFGNKDIVGQYTIYLDKTNRSYHGLYVSINVGISESQNHYNEFYVSGIDENISIAFMLDKIKLPKGQWFYNTNAGKKKIQKMIDFLTFVKRQMDDFYDIHHAYPQMSAWDFWSNKRTPNELLDDWNQSYLPKIDKYIKIQNMCKER